MGDVNKMKLKNEADWLAMALSEEQVKGLFEGIVEALKALGVPVKQTTPEGKEKYAARKKLELMGSMYRGLGRVVFTAAMGLESVKPVCEELMKVMNEWGLH